GPPARVHHAPPGRATAPAGQLRRPGLGPGDRPPPAPRRHPPGAAARPPLRLRAPSGPDGADQLLGLQLDRLFRPRGPLLLDRDPGPAGQRVQGDGPQPARGRDRGDPRRRLQPHRRGQPHGPDAVVPGPGQQLLLPDGGLQPALLHGLHRHRQHPERPPPPGAGPDPGLAALLGRGDARRRLPLRPGQRPGPQLPRGRPAVGLLRPDPPGPGGEPGEADRRALGRGRGRLPGRQLPGAVDRVERPLPRHHARLLARRPHRGGRHRLPAHRLQRPVPVRRPPAVRQHQLRHLPRRLHPERPGQLRQQANRGNRGGNRDGTTDNRSWNCGVEGPTDDLEVNHLRERQKRNFLASLLLSAGVPMLLAGDELGRTQQGNNNAYCQDNEISWVDWELDEDSEALVEFTRAVIALRRDHPVLRRRKFFQGQAIHGSGVKDIGWFTPDGAEMDETHWRASDVSTLGVFLNGEELPDRGPRGQRMVDASFLLLFNGGTEPALFTLPGDPWAKESELVAATGLASVAPPGPPRAPLPGAPWAKKYELVPDTGLPYVRPHGADAPSYLAGEELSMT